MTGEAVKNCRRLAKISRCHDGLHRGFDSYDAIVHAYIGNYRVRAKREFHFYASQPDFEQAVKTAAFCLSPGGKRHSHQCRIPGQVLKAMRQTLMSADLKSSTNFAELYDRVNEATRPIAGIGSLTVYDVAHRIGAHLGFAPQDVYLHAGTRKGAAAIGLRGKILPKNAFPGAFQKLTAGEIEDCLCIYKDEIRSVATRSRKP